jgi:enamine deaminase RidA (YjgF/YER057c/UK114 family)
MMVHRLPPNGACGGAASGLDSRPRAPPPRVTAKDWKPRAQDCDRIGRTEMMENNMAVSIERVRPDFLWNKPHFTNLVTSRGGRTVHLSGLVAATAAGELVGPGDLGAQMAWIYDTVRRALALVAAGPADVVRQRVFIVGLEPGHRPTIMKAMTDFYGDDRSAASTCVGVPSLLVEGALVEIDVTAVVDG